VSNSWRHGVGYMLVGVGDRVIGTGRCSAGPAVRFFRTRGAADDYDQGLDNPATAVAQKEMRQVCMKWLQGQVFAPCCAGLGCDTLRFALQRSALRGWWWRSNTDEAAWWFLP
jgi:hypothetical protein